MAAAWGCVSVVVAAALASRVERSTRLGGSGEEFSARLLRDTAPHPRLTHTPVAPQAKESEEHEQQHQQLNQQQQQATNGANAPPLEDTSSACCGHHQPQAFSPEQQQHHHHHAPEQQQPGSNNGSEVRSAGVVPQQPAQGGETSAAAAGLERALSIPKAWGKDELDVSGDGNGLGWAGWQGRETLACMHVCPHACMSARPHACMRMCVQTRSPPPHTQFLELDNAWLDRLDSGFDFADLLGDAPAGHGPASDGGCSCCSLHAHCLTRAGAQPLLGQWQR